MKLQKPGKNTLNKAEVIGITRFGIWVLVHDTEYYLDYTEFPWFRRSKVEDIYNLEFKHGKHLRWKKLDIDIELDSLKNLKQYPLKYS